MFSLEIGFFFSSCWNNCSESTTYNLRFFILSLPIYYYFYYWHSSKQVIIVSNHGFPPLYKIVTSTWLGSNCLKWASMVFLSATSGFPGFSPSVPLSWEGVAFVQLLLLETLPNPLSPWELHSIHYEHLSDSLVPPCTQPFSLYWVFSFTHQEV